MKKFFLLFFALSSVIFSQAEYVRTGHSVYKFLERMENLHIISNYNSFEYPKTRREVSAYLKEVLNRISELNKVDKAILEDYKVEFEYDIFQTSHYSASLIGGTYDLFSLKEKYIYHLTEKEKAAIFINIIGESEAIIFNDKKKNEKYSALLLNTGGEIRGTLLNKFGFQLRAANGKVFNDKAAALALTELKYNFKLNEKAEESFFDETEGYLTADFSLVKFKIGRDRLNIGYGIKNSLLGSEYPLFDYLGMNLNYKFFNYSFFHGKLLGEQKSRYSSAGFETIISDKYLAYHRIGFNLSDDFDIGFGEMVVYGDRPVDFSYLNPFTFYKTIEHSNRDRDNALLFFDANNNSIKGMKFYLTFLIDDINFSKIGTGWWGNQTMLDAGFSSDILYNHLPLTFGAQYVRVEPYTFTHRFARNNFTNYSYSITPFQPNSENIMASVDYNFSSSISATADFQYTIHGANNSENYGGDILKGRRNFDSEIVNFLDGDLEYSRKMSLSLSYEPFNQLLIFLNLKYVNESLKNIRKEELQAFGGINILF